MLKFLKASAIAAGFAGAFQQTDQDRFWIRWEFLDHEDPHPLFVIHGHTPVDAPEVRANRIGIDTGAGFGRRRPVARPSVSEPGAPRSVRRAAFFRAADATPLLSACTQWAFVDWKTLRPKRIPPEVLAVYPQVER